MQTLGTPTTFDQFIENQKIKHQHVIDFIKEAFEEYKQYKKEEGVTFANEMQDAHSSLASNIKSAIRFYA
jgi:hypothetical protein